MPLSSEPQEELKKQKECETATEPLRTKWDDDWALIRLDSTEYEIPTEEGDWEKVVTNRAAAEFYRITDYLAYARRKIWIPISEEDKKGRKELTQTEQLANGCIYLADKKGYGLPSYRPSQYLMSVFRVLRGWSSKRYLLRDKDDELVSDFAEWDSRNTYWIEGNERLIWVCYITYRDKFQIVDQYPGWNGAIGLPEKMGESNLGQKLTAVYDIWAVEGDKEAQEAVIINNEYVKEPVGIDRHYLPIIIQPGRGTPLISDGKHDDNIKFVGENFLASNRKLHPAESRLLSYQMTRASQQAKAPVMVQFDSELAPQPTGFEKDPYVKGRTIFFDKAKGQEFSDRLLPPAGADIMTMISVLQGLLQIGGLSGLAHGQPPYPETAQGTDIIAHLDLQKMNPFKLGLESDYVWWAEEIVRQYKEGDFKEYEIEGRDKANNPFKVTINPKKIDTNWKFQCELIPDLLRDKAANLNWVVQAIKSGLISIESGRDQSGIVVDTDLESTKVAREQARALLNIGEVEAVLALVEDYAKSPNEKSMFLAAYALQKLQETLGGGQQGQPQPGSETMPAKQDNNLGAVPDQIRQAAIQQQMMAQGTTAQGAPPRGIVRG